MERDDAILELCQRGHPAGFARLVETYQQRVWRTAYRFLHDREDARDVTQEVFLRTARAIGSLDPRRPLWPWLRRVTVNLCLNLLRRRAPVVPLDMAPEGTAEPAADLPPWTRLDLERALGELPPLWRMAVTLRHQEDLTYEEIAALMQLPVGTVKTYIFRGRRALRERLSHREA